MHRFRYIFIFKYNAYRKQDKKNNILCKKYDKETITLKEEDRQMQIAEIMAENHSGLDLKMFNLEHRLLLSLKDFDKNLIEKEINWGEVNAILKNKQAEAINFLNTNLTI